jgi:signal peptidase
MTDSGGPNPHRDDDVGVDDPPDDDVVPETRPDDGAGPAAPPDHDAGHDGRPDGAAEADGSVTQDGDGRSARSTNARPAPQPGRTASVPDPTERPVLWYLRTERPLVVASRDVLSSVLLVTILGLALFAVSGVWPPLVAVESGSMEPNMERGDLVLVVEEDRFTSSLADEHGIVTAAAASGTQHEQFGERGSVIVYRPNGDDGTPIIHRVAFAVDRGDNWVAMADSAYLGTVDECSDVASCPAQYEGYITRGDANAQYDQVAGQSTVVKPSWIRGRAVSRTPYLGCIRLALSEGGLCGAEGR